MKKIEKEDNELLWKSSVMPRQFPPSVGSEEFEGFPNDPLSLGSKDLDILPVDFMKQLAGTITSETPYANHTDKYQKSLPQWTERKTKTDKLILVPGAMDVLMGKGRHNKSHPGNQKLNLALEKYLDKYEASDKFEKTVLSHTLVLEMLDSGSRFLIREGQKERAFWVEVPLEKARLKISHDLRNLRRVKKQTAMMATEPFTDVVSSSTITNSNNNKVGAPKRQRSQINATQEQNQAKTKKSSIMGI